MAKFAHLADSHLGSWKQQPMQDLNLQSFQKAIDHCIKEKVEFVLIAGDLFDSAYPPIEILKETFAQLKKLYEAKIPCFIIAGSHDYSVSGKTFLDVLEKSGFCKNAQISEEKNGKIILNPIIFKDVAIYGYPGRRAGLEVSDLRKVQFNDSPGFFKIFMLHTTLDKVKGDLPIDAITPEELPKADYYALGHIHLDFQYENFVYPGPLFPNNFQELEDLRQGSFYIVETVPDVRLKKIDLKAMEIISISVNVNDASTATDKIISEIKKQDIEGKLVLLRVKGFLENGRHSDIKFHKIEELVKQKKAYFLLKNTHELKIQEIELEIKAQDTENIEGEIIKSYSEENQSEFNKFIHELVNALEIEKQEDEKNVIFENRVLDNVKKILNI